MASGSGWPLNKTNSDLPRARSRAFSNFRKGSIPFMSTTGNLVLPLAAAPIAVQSPLPVNHQWIYAGPVAPWKPAADRSAKDIHLTVSHSEGRPKLLDRANDAAQKHESPRPLRGAKSCLLEAFFTKC